MIGNFEAVLLVPLLHHWILLNMLDVVAIVKEDALQDGEVVKAELPVTELAEARKLQRPEIGQYSGKGSG